MNRQYVRSVEEVVEWIGFHRAAALPFDMEFILPIELPVVVRGGGQKGSFAYDVTSSPYRANGLGSFAHSIANSSYRANGENSFAGLVKGSPFTGSEMETAFIVVSLEESIPAVENTTINSINIPHIDDYFSDPIKRLLEAEARKMFMAFGALIDETGGYIKSYLTKSTEIGKVPGGTIDYNKMRYLRYNSQMQYFLIGEATSPGRFEKGVETTITTSYSAGMNGGSRRVNAEMGISMDTDTGQSHIYSRTEAGFGTKNINAGMFMETENYKDGTTTYTTGIEAKAETPRVFKTKLKIGVQTGSKIIKKR